MVEGNLMTKKLFVFMGLPGAGKGALSQMLLVHSGWSVVSAGDLCRYHVENLTDIGKKIDFAIKSGNLISDQLVSEMVQNELAIKKISSDHIILDGYPRTIGQAVAFNDLLKLNMVDWGVVIVRFMVSDQVVMTRLTDRVVCENTACRKVYSLNADSICCSKDGQKCEQCGALLIRRSDDTQAVVIKRLAIYHQFENELIHFYRKSGYEVVDLDGEKPLNQVFDFFMDRVVGQLN